jgi:hypothetical protein
MYSSRTLELLSRLDIADLKDMEKDIKLAFS